MITKIKQFYNTCCARLLNFFCPPVPKEIVEFREWYIRWDKAMDRCWKILEEGEPSKSRFNRFSKYHDKLIKMSENKCEKVRTLLEERA